MSEMRVIFLLIICIGILGIVLICLDHMNDTLKAERDQAIIEHDEARKERDAMAAKLKQSWDCEAAFEKEAKNQK